MELKPLEGMVEFEEVLFADGVWRRTKNFSNDFPEVGEAPRANDKYRYFLCKDRHEHIYMYRSLNTEGIRGRFKG